MKATQKFVRPSARKLRLIAKAVRGQKAETALNNLRFMEKRAALPLYKTLFSAVANARAKGITQSDLVINKIDIGEGPTYKRWRAVSRGSAHSIMKRTSHINIELKEKDNGTKS